MKNLKILESLKDVVKSSQLNDKKKQHLLDVLNNLSDINNKQ